MTWYSLSVRPYTDSETLRLNEDGCFEEGTISQGFLTRWSSYDTIQVTWYPGHVTYRRSFAVSVNSSSHHDGGQSVVSSVCRPVSVWSAESCVRSARLWLLLGTGHLQVARVQFTDHSLYLICRCPLARPVLTSVRVHGRQTVGRL